MKTVVISAFPACGKSYFFSKNKTLKILDSDSSNFHRKDGKLDLEWYVNEHIKGELGKHNYILVSSYLDVRKKLEDEKINFITVYPAAECKQSFLKRMKERGNDKNFLELLDKNWNSWVNKIDNEPHGKQVIRLNKNEYLSDLYNAGKLNLE